MDSVSTNNPTPNPTYPLIYECEQHLLRKPRVTITKASPKDLDFDLQSLDVRTYGEEHVEVMRHLRGMIPHLTGAQQDTVVWLIGQIEKVAAVSYWFKKCDTYADYTMLMLTAYHTFTGKTVSKKFLEDSLVFNLQGEDNVGDLLRTLRKGLNGASTIEENPLIARIIKVYSFLLVHGFLAKFGITMDDEHYSKIQQKHMALQYSSKTGMLLAICETTLFVCERVYEYKLTGIINIWGNNATDYEEWFEQADRLIALSPFTSNLEPHGTNYYQFLSDLKDCIERGKAYSLFVEKSSGHTYPLMHRKLASLRLIESSELTRRNAMEERKAPFGVLVCGSSSVAKSTFSKVLFYYYAHLHKQNPEDHFRYVRNPADDYWSNFDTSKWCIQLDDIAFMLPNKTGDIDPTLKELLNVVNNVPYVPPQAALEDKGRTPVRAELVIATTNARDLNAHEYFWCPLAVQRRLPYVVEIEPKPEYLHSNGRFIDPEKLGYEDHRFPNYWLIKVLRIQPHFDGQRELAKLELVQEFDDIDLFLKHYGEHTMEHLNNQNKSKSCDEHMRKLFVCDRCYMVPAKCGCLHWQSHDVAVSFLGSIKEFLWSMWMSLWFFIAASDIFFRINLALGRWRVVRYVTLRFFSHVYTQSRLLRLLESFRVHSVGGPAWCTFLAALGIAVVVMRSVGSTRCAHTNPANDKVSQVPSGHGGDAEVQGGCSSGEERSTLSSDDDVRRFTDVKSRLAREERRNVWYNPTMQLATFEVPVASLSLANSKPEQVRDICSRNVVRIKIRYVKDGVNRVCSTGGVILVGNIVMVNEHTLPHVDHLKIEVISAPVTDGVTPNFEMFLHGSSIYRLPAHDIALFRALSLPPRKSLLKFWGETHVDISKAIVISRSIDGRTEFSVERGVTAYPKMHLPALGRDLNVYMVNKTTMTKPGDCGALLVSCGPRGPIINGIHTFGNGTLAGYVHLSRTVLEESMNQLLTTTILPYVVQGSHGPDLTLEDKTIPLTTLHHKSVFRYFEHGVVDLYGSLLLPRCAPKSSVRPTYLSREMSEYFGVELKHGKPCMSGWEPWRKNIVEMVQPPIVMDQNILHHCVKAFTTDILAYLDGTEWRDELFFLDKTESVNGMKGVLFVDRVNVSSSMGFPWNTSKRKYVRFTGNAEEPEEITFTEDVWERFDAIVRHYKNGERAFPIFTGHLKDEAVTKEKMEAKKTRLFTGAPIDWSLVVRSRLLSFVRLVQLNKYAFEAGPGTVCQSSEWSDIREYLTYHGEARIVAGDYGKYDKRMIADIILAAFDVIVRIHKEAGFSDNELRQIACIGYDVAFSIVNMGGDLVGFYGTEPSGHPLTVIVNSLVNSLYMRYAYYKLNPGREAITFKQNVHLFTYGDDNIMGVSTQAEWFNHTTIQSEMSKIGVEYTMADKSMETKPYMHINECNFLKRSWRWDEDVGDYLCPLDIDSIHKSLLIGVPSKEICPEEQMVDIISSANTEFWFHGKQTFEEHRKFFIGILQQEDLVPYVADSTLPDWHALYERYVRASEEVASHRLWSRSIIRGYKRPQKHDNKKNIESGDSLPESSEHGRTDLEDCAIVTREPSFTSQFMKVELQSDDIEETVSDVAGGTSLAADPDLSSQQLSFTDNNAGVLYEIPTTKGGVAYVDSTADLSLGEFLSRPTLIDTITWTTSNTQGQVKQINPWNLFLSSAAIKRKIDNFAFIRGKLHVKFVLNGTPFQYGLMRVSYVPMSGLLSSKINVVANSPANATMIPLSQMPGIYLQPQDNAGGEMTLPFLYHKNWLELTSFNTTAFGALIYYIFDGLDVAISTASTTVSIQTYAWMSEVELMGSTATMALQGADEDEYGNGPVSAPASAVAAMASSIGHIPIIGRFARATEIGASAVSEVAKLFGYTNVPNIENVNAIQPTVLPHLSSAHISTHVNKLTLDPKQELSIDPSIHGLGSSDELSIAYLKKKESYFGGFTWSTSNNVGDLLFTVAVTPCLSTIHPINNASSVQVGNQVTLTPLGMLGTIFNNWRGELIYRLKIVATKYHKGRLKIVYDPFSPSTSTANPPENTVYTHILDIGELDDFEMRIPYHQPTAWCNSTDGLVQNWGSSPGSASHTPTVTNGTFSVYVATKLSAPSSGNLNVFCFSRGGDSLEFANPEGQIAIGGRPPSFFQLQSEDRVDLVPKSITMGAPTQVADERYHMNYGESFCSLRALMRRYAKVDRSVITFSPSSHIGSTYGYTRMEKEFKRMPYFGGYVPGIGNYFGCYATSKLLSAGSSGALYNGMHILPYVTSCFIGYRGSVNYSVTFTNYSDIDAIFFERYTKSSTGPKRTMQIGNTMQPSDSLAKCNSIINQAENYGYQTDCLGGCAVTSTRTNNGLQFSIPDYNFFNFSLADPFDYYDSTIMDGTDMQGGVLKASISPQYATDIASGTSVFTPIITTLAGAGTDFTCIFFLCVPTLHVALNPLPSV